MWQLKKNFSSSFTPFSHTCTTNWHITFLLTSHLDLGIDLQNFPISQYQTNSTARSLISPYSTSHSETRRRHGQVSCPLSSIPPLILSKVETYQCSGGLQLKHTSLCGNNHGADSLLSVQFVPTSFVHITLTTPGSSYPTHFTFTMTLYDSQKC